MKIILKYKDWNIFTKVFSLAVLILIPMLMLFIFELLPSIETKLISEKKRNVKNTVEVAYGIVENYFSQYNSGVMTASEAQTAAKEALEKIRYESEEYFWINTFDLKMVMHPIKKELNNNSVADVKDPNGTYIFKEMVNIAKSEGDGYLEYMWPKPGYNEPIPKISYIKSFNEWNWVIGSGIYVNDVEEDLSAFIAEINIFLVLLGIVALALGIFTARNISKPLKELETAADKVSKGDIDVEVENNSSNEIGKLSNSFNIMVANIKKSIEEANRKGEEAEVAAQKAKEAEMLAIHQQEYLAKNTKTLLAEMDRFSEGDLTVYVKPEKEDDDIGKLFNGFNRAVGKIKDIVNKVTEAIQATASASTEISSSSEQMAAGAQEQSAQSAEVASAVEEMTKTITEMAGNAASANNSSSNSKDQAVLGSETVSKSKAGFDRIIQSAQKTGSIIASLTSRTNQIGEIIQVIDEIADQTNLLALNAAIEAARAGEDGRGFAVVADEVRKLAERTTSATKEIADTIKTVQSEATEANDSMVEAKTVVDEGKRLNEEVEKSLSVILEGIKNVNLQINQVAAASEQQSTAAEEISKNIESISTVTQESAMGVQQVARAAEDLNNLTENLQLLISQFKRDGSESDFHKGSYKLNEEKFYSSNDNDNGRISIGGNGYH